MFIIKKVNYNKKAYLQLLLLADPSERMIDLYLDNGDMYVLSDNNKIICEAVVVKISDKVCEIKNIATNEEYQRKGYAKKLLEYLFGIYKTDCKDMYVGTTKAVMPFYNKLGFQYSYTKNNFFKDNYNASIFEDGAQCIDMIYLKRDLMG